jgi:hypothetical protein
MLQRVGPDHVERLQPAEPSSRIRRARGEPEDPRTDREHPLKDGGRHEGAGGQGGAGAEQESSRDGGGNQESRSGTEGGAFIKIRVHQPFFEYGSNRNQSNYNIRSR